MGEVVSGRDPSGPGSCPSDQAASHPAPAGGDPSRNGLRHYPRRHWTGTMEIVDREFDFVRCQLPYDYRFTSNSQQWREAEAICRALEGPMEALGVHTVAASGTDAQRAETGTGSVHDGPALAEGDAHPEASTSRVGEE